MISVIVYGRNDDHGYNLHRRVALSLNCLAEILDAECDEILFVDYNTADGLPTLIEAIADILTSRCTELLRVFRVREREHARRFGDSTHLAVVEPVARNVAARRSNPRNRWLLSTNTDMILVPSGPQSLSQIAGALDDGFYAIPRYEIPEWVWEQFPRTNGRRTLIELARLGPALSLDEPTASHPEMGYDAPGDFQLVLRDDFFAIDGFDEEMIHGWHVDTNLSKRLFVRHGSVQSLENVVAGYHCNHNRTLTVYHGTGRANDLTRFFHGVVEPDIPHQRETWGMVGEPVERISIGPTADEAFTSAVLASLQGSASVERLRFDATETRFSMEYDSHHVLPFVVDAIRTAPQSDVIAYVGANSVLEGLVATVVDRVSEHALLVAQLGEPASLAAVAGAADVFVVDLGLDAASFGEAVAEGSGHEYTQARRALLRVFEALRQLVELERKRQDAGSLPRRFVLVNSTALFWDAFVCDHFVCGSTTPHARVRNAVVRPVSDGSETKEKEWERLVRLVRWIGRDDSRTGSLALNPARAARLRELHDYSGFGRGWMYPDEFGIWTVGTRAELAIDIRDRPETCSLSLAFDAIGIPAPDLLSVALSVNGSEIDRTTFGYALSRGDTHMVSPRGRRRILRSVLAALARRARAAGVPGVDSTIAAVRRARRRLAVSRRLPMPEERPVFSWKVELPGVVDEASRLELVFTLEEPVAWGDDRHLGLHLSALELELE